MSHFGLLLEAVHAHLGADKDGVDGALEVLARADVAHERVLEQPLGCGMEVCPKEDAAYGALNGTMKGLYPTLERALSEPDEFKADLQGRFEKQKKIKKPEMFFKCITKKYNRKKGSRTMFR